MYLQAIQFGCQPQKIKKFYVIIFGGRCGGTYGRMEYGGNNGNDSSSNGRATG